MPESSRSLPDQPSLRFLKLEARRRLATGEFSALHEAQLAIAREYGFSSWTTLKQVVGDSQPDPDEAVLDHLGWVVSRLAGAGQPDWAPPAEQELAEHFEQSYLDRVTPGQLIKTLSAMARARWLRDEVIVITARPRFIRARAGDVQIETVGADKPPQRLRGITAHRIGESITDTRVTTPPPTRRAKSRKQRSPWPRRPSVRSACPGWCWPESTTMASRGSWPAAGPGWTRKSRSARPTGSGPRDQHTDHCHRRAPPGR